MRDRLRFERRELAAHAARSVRVILTDDPRGQVDGIDRFEARLRASAAAYRR